MKLLQRKTLLVLLFLSTVFVGASFAVTEDIPLETMIGQMIMVGFVGAEVKDPSFNEVIDYIEGDKIGGLVFYERNISDNAVLKKFIAEIKALKKKQSLFLAIDQEGGKVSRLRELRGYKTFPSAKYVANNLSVTQAYDLYSDMAKELYDLGFNLNFGPVIDLDINPKSPAIGFHERSYSRTPDVVVIYAGQFMLAHKNNKVLTTLKHYPGHGSASADSHLGFTDVSGSWDQAETIPYSSLIQEGKVDLIMSAHIFNEKVDVEFPASLSKIHLQANLCQKLGYKGLIISDDLQMGALSKSYDLETIVIKAIEAGTDILLFANYFVPGTLLPDKVIAIIKEAVRNGKITQNQIQTSYQKIIDIKQ